MRLEKNNVFLLACLLFLSVSTVTAYVNIEVNDKVGTYYPGQNITGDVVIKYNEYFDRDSVLEVCMDTCSESSPYTQLYDFLYPVDQYAYQPQSVSYYLNSSGYNNWTEFPRQDFTYEIKANGTCGGCGPGTCGGESFGCGYPAGGDPACDCNVGSVCVPIGDKPYPCIWHDEVEFTSKVNMSEGLKFILQSTIGIPSSSNNDTAWYVTVLENHENVTGTMRKACGSETYETHPVTKTGWVKRKGTGYLLCPDFECVKPGACNGLCGSTWLSSGGNRYNCIENFDSTSLGRPGGKPYTAYGGPVQADFPKITYTTDGKFGGGIYKSLDGITWEYQEFNLILEQPGVIWNASDYLHGCDGRGYIMIKNWDPNAYYTMVYLPPNGNHTCAYTNVTANASSEWVDYAPSPNTPRGCTNCMSYTNPYTNTTSTSTLANLLKPCPSYVLPNDCRKTGTFYEGYLSGPYGITTTYRPAAGELDTVVSTTIKTLAAENRTNVNFTRFYNLKAPSSGSHDLIIRIINSSQNIVSNTTYQLNVGLDWDNDGYLAPQDCNDTNPDVWPGAPEVCDSFDNDCDGQRDEGFGDENRTSGLPCFDWPKSACAGTWVCDRGRETLVCSSGLIPGDQEEICLNDLDDDCDGVVDEDEEMVNGTSKMACTFKCKNGQSTECGSSIGECEVGYRICVNREWTECIDNIGPATETCNGKDDDCDGVIDNIKRREGVEDTQCACYGGSLPALSETCNDIDDNCNGQIDEGVRCCEPGQKRQCGTDMGVCTYGTQSCNDGRWGECVNGINPQMEEICYDDLDNTCDGTVDELCDPKVTCFNKARDLNEMGTDCGGDCSRPCEDYNPWIIVSIVIAVLILGAGVLEYTGKL